MTKEIVNNKITFPNIHGRIIQHDIYLNQGVRQGDSPTFSNLQLTGNATIEGNLYVQGNTTILDSNIIEFEDNIILLNRVESGAGVTLNQSGIEIERGSLENYRIVFNESDDTFRVGLISNTQAVATRENTPLLNGIMVWNDTSTRLDSSNTISIDVTFNSTTNSSSSSSGSISVSGGLGVGKDMYIDGHIYLNNSSSVWSDTSNNLNMTSIQDIYISPVGTLQVPFNKKLSFGNTEQSISANSISKDIEIYGKGNVFFYMDSSKRISVPNQVPITFSTQNEKVYTDSSNNMVIEGSQNIDLIPGPNKKVTIPVDVPISFSNPNQQISANLNNDLNIISGNNIFLTPFTGLDVRIPTDSGIKFGGTGNQRIYVDNNQYFNFVSSSDIFFTPTSGSKINIPANIPITFGGNTQYIQSSTSGELNIASSDSLTISNTFTKLNSTVDATSASNASLYTLGGIGVAKRIYSDLGLSVKSTNSQAINILQNNTTSTFLINNQSSGNIQIYCGNGSSTQSSLKLSSQSQTNAGSLLQLVTNFDNTLGYEIGRGNDSLNGGRTMTVNIPTYLDYSNTGTKPKFSITSSNHTQELFSVETDTGNVTSLGAFQVSNTMEAENASTGSFVVFGGLAVGKNIFTNGRYTSITSHTEAMSIKDVSNENIYTLDTINKTSTFNSDINIVKTTGTVLSVNNNFTIDIDNNILSSSLVNKISNTTDTTDLSSGSLVVYGGTSISKKLRVGDLCFFNNGVNMNNTRITNVLNPTNDQDAATKSYVDLVKQGLFVKDSVKVATTSALTLANDFVSGNIVDDYTLQLNDRILVKNQLDNIENGIYIVKTSGAPIRSTDLNTGSSASGCFVFVENGTLNASLGWICNSVSLSDIVGTDTLGFTQFTGLGQVTDGDGLTKTFNRLDINVDDSSIEINSDILRVKNTIAGTGLTGGSGSPLQTLADQSHVTALGNIITGSWQASNIGVSYGGTGRTRFTSGNILFGNGTNGINTNSKFFYDSSNTRLGLGTNVPTEMLHIKDIGNTIVLLDANSDGNDNNAHPEIIFAHTGTQRAKIGFSRNFNDFANDVYNNCLVFENTSTNSDSIIQFVTNDNSRMTILHNGNVGINTSIPNYTLDVNGTFSTTGLNNFKSTMESTSWSNGSTVIDGGVGIAKNLNVNGYTHLYNTLIVDNAVSMGNVDISNNLNITNNLVATSSTFSNLTLSGTLSNTFTCNGGTSILYTSDANSVTNGGSLTIAGGTSISKSLYVGGNQFNSGYLDLNGTMESIINIYNGNVKQWSLDKPNNDFSLSLYNSSGSLYQTSFIINSLNGTTTFYNTIESTTPSTGCLVLKGGMSVSSIADAIDLTNGGGITNLGGQSITKKLLVGGNVEFKSSTQSTNASTGSLVVKGGVGIYNNTFIDGKLTVNDTLNYNGNGLFDIVNNTSGSTNWNYLGKCTGYTEIELSNGVTDNLTTPGINGLKFIVSVFDTNVSVSHQHFGNLLFDSVNKSDAIIYTENNNLHLFVTTPNNSKTNIRVYSQTGDNFVLSNEGYAAEPNGDYSGYDNTWTLYYKSNKESNLTTSVGDFTVEGTTLKICDNLPIIGYNNINTSASRDLGIVFERFQSSNDSGTGDIVTGNAVLIDNIPSQLGANSDQIKFSNIANATDDYYNGWWIKVGTGSNLNQVRKIISYNGSTRVAQLNTPWTTQNPVATDTIYIYGSSYIGTYYDETNDRFKIAYSSISQTGEIQHHNDCDLQVKNLNITDTTASVNSSVGSITTLGGIAINNNTNSYSCTNGGSITTLGGASIRKTLYVGDNIGVGNGNFTPQESLHINQTNSTLRLQNDNSEYSYIDFVETSNSNRFGIINDSNLFSLTYSSSNQNPYNSNKSLTVNSAGSIGIKTTSINSALSILNNNFISTDSNAGFIGMIAGNTNTNDYTNGARLLLYGTTSGSNSGNAEIHTSTNGSFKVFTNTDVEQLSISKFGITVINSTETSKSKTSGALIVSGGVGISATENSTSITNGGSLTVAGGAAIGKDIYVGGDLIVSGNIAAGGSVTTPTITFSNTSGCSITSYANSSLINISNEGILTFSVDITPIESSTNCQFTFSLPSRTNNFTQRGELVATCTGYSNDTDLIPLFNCLCVGITSTTDSLVKFQSVNTGIHYLTIMCRYTLV